MRGTDGTHVGGKLSLNRRANGASKGMAFSGSSGLNILATRSYFASGHSGSRNTWSGREFTSLRQRGRMWQLRYPRREMTSAENSFKAPKDLSN